MNQYYPDSGPLRRELYPKHLEFFAAGMKHRERLFLAANRVGKTEGVGAYEVNLHLTGLYPPWWNGRRFTKPVKVWAAGETGVKVREVIQEKLFGSLTSLGTGMIPGDLIAKTTHKPGVNSAIDQAWISHVSGGQSRLVLKSYEQGPEAFESDEVDVIWLDEECKRDIYTACLMRTMTTNGIIIFTFTPLNGMSDIVRDFLNLQTKEQ